MGSREVEGEWERISQWANTSINSKKRKLGTKMRWEFAADMVVCVSLAPFFRHQTLGSSFLGVHGVP